MKKTHLIALLAILSALFLLACGENAKGSTADILYTFSKEPKCLRYTDDTWYAVYQKEEKTGTVFACGKDISALTAFYTVPAACSVTSFDAEGDLVVWCEEENGISTYQMLVLPNAQPHTIGEAGSPYRTRILICNGTVYYLTREANEKRSCLYAYDPITHTCTLAASDERNYFYDLTDSGSSLLLLSDTISVRDGATAAQMQSIRLSPSSDMIHAIAMEEDSDHVLSLALSYWDRENGVRCVGYLPEGENEPKAITNLAGDEVIPEGGISLFHGNVLWITRIDAGESQDSTYRLTVWNAATGKQQIYDKVYAFETTEDTIYGLLSDKSGVHLCCIPLE